MRKLVTLLAVPALFSLSACVSHDGMTRKQNEEMTVKLTALQKEIDLLKKEVRGVKMKRMGVSGADLAKLNRIKPLSSKPADEEIRKYIDAVLLTAKGKKSCSSRDFQIELLAQIGPGHLNVILPYLKKTDWNVRFYWERAIDRLVLESDKKLVLKNLKECPVLFNTVTRNGWVREAKDAIMDSIKSGKVHWVFIPALPGLVTTEADRKIIVEAYVNHPNGSGLFNLIKTFPDADPADLANKAWNKWKEKNDWTKLAYAIHAAEYGNIDALEELVVQVEKKQNRDNSYLKERVYLLTGQSLNDVFNWFLDNRDNLVFNKKKQRFDVKK